MKNMTIKGLLTWAFTEELCKQGAGGNGSFGLGEIKSAWAAISDVGALGTVIDRSPNAYGVMPGYVEAGEPHDDAIAVAEAVRALTAQGFDIPEGWYPFPEWDDERGLIAIEVERVMALERARGMRQTGRHAYNLIVTCAVLGRGPDWQAERPEEQMVMHQGRPAWFVVKRSKDTFGHWHEYEGDGYDRRGQRPRQGAYRKHMLSEPLHGAIMARIDWLVWQAALKLLERHLEPRLAQHHLTPMRFDPSPWWGKTGAIRSGQVIEKAC